MWNKDQAKMLNKCTSNKRPYEAPMKVPNIPNYLYVSNKFIPFIHPLTKTQEYKMVSTGPACAIYDPNTLQADRYEPWKEV